MSFWWIIGASRGDYWCSLLVGIAGSPTDRPPTTSGQEVRTIIGPSLWLGSEADAAGNRESLTSELRLPRQQIREGEVEGEGGRKIMTLKKNFLGVQGMAYGGRRTEDGIWRTTDGQNIFIPIRISHPFK
ncbi:unnamed protein product, partial [Nesidiocoris tenuis]